MSLVVDRVMGEGHNHGTSGGISQDPIGIKVKGINDEHDRSKTTIVRDMWL